VQWYLQLQDREAAIGNETEKQERASCGKDGSGTPEEESRKRMRKCGCPELKIRIHELFFSY
jgi:hypothetical protein